MEMEDVSYSSPTAPQEREEVEDRSKETREEQEGSEDAREEQEGSEDAGEDKSDREEVEVKDTLLKDESVKIDILSEGDDTATLPLSKKKNLEQKEQLKEKPPMVLFPITRLKLAWTRSSNICDFIVKAIFIVFSTIGWMFCIGGVPFISLALLIIGSIYIDDCKIQPNIPVYLIVTGVLGTVQHFIAIWTKYVPKDSQGRLKSYRTYCKVVDNFIHLFLFIWFVLGCIWVYGVFDEVEYRDTEKNEYCHKTLYLFAFWILNLSFIILALLTVLSLCCILCIVASSRDKEKGASKPH